MNEKFFALPKEKQDRIINAGLKCFAKNGYRHAVTSEIAAEADISKGLLFHYFGNKKGLYAWLFQFSAKYMLEQLEKRKTLIGTDFFDMVMRAAHDKAEIIKERPYIYQFITNVYYDEDPVSLAIIKDTHKIEKGQRLQAVLDQIDQSKFREGVDFFTVFQLVVWCSEGFMLQRQWEGSLDDLDDICATFDHALEEMKRAFYKEEYL